MYKSPWGYEADIGYLEHVQKSIQKFCYNKNKNASLTTGEKEIEQRKLDRVLSPEPENGVLPPDEATQDEQYRYGGQADEHDHGIALLHDVERAVAAEHEHDGDGAVGDRGPVDGAHEHAARHERTHLVEHAVEHVHELDERVALRVHDDVGEVALRARHLHRTVALLLLVDPALQAALVHPLGRAAAFARAHPLSRVVVVFGREADPAVLSVVIID